MYRSHFIRFTFLVSMNPNTFKTFHDVDTKCYEIKGIGEMLNLFNLLW